MGEQQILDAIVWFCIAGVFVALSVAAVAQVQVVRLLDRYRAVAGAVEGVCRCGTNASMDLENKVGRNRRWVCDVCGGHVCYENELEGLPASPAAEAP